MLDKIYLEDIINFKVITGIEQNTLQRLSLGMTIWDIAKEDGVTPPTVFYRIASVKEEVRGTTRRGENK